MAEGEEADRVTCVETTRERLRSKWLIEDPDMTVHFQVCVFVHRCPAGLFRLQHHTSRDGQIKCPWCNRYRSLFRTDLHSLTYAHSVLVPTGLLGAKVCSCALTLTQQHVLNHLTPFCHVHQSRQDAVQQGISYRHSCIKRLQLLSSVDDTHQQQKAVT